MCDIESSPACTRVKAPSFPLAQHRGRRRSSDAGHSKGHGGVAVEGRTFRFDLLGTTTTSRMSAMVFLIDWLRTCRMPAMHPSGFVGFLMYLLFQRTPTVSTTPPARMVSQLGACPTLPSIVALLLPHVTFSREAPRVCSVKHIEKRGGPPMRKIESENFLFHANHAARWNSFWGGALISQPLTPALSSPLCPFSVARLASSAAAVAPAYGTL